MSDPRSSRAPEPSRWAEGGVSFAAYVLILVGSFEILAGLVAIFDDEFYVVARNYTFELDTSAWGWIHLLLGVLLIFIGSSLLSRRLWAVVGGIAIAMLSALANFFFIPYYPFWSLVMIALDVWVIWALTRPGTIRD
jgi:hypothetical protein